MNVNLEIFTVRPLAKSLGYKRWTLDVSAQETDPEETVSEFVESLIGRLLAEGEVLTHSTSWRYSQPGNIVLTYLSYSEVFQTNDAWSVLAIDEVDAKNGKSLSGDSSQADVLAHGLRHFAFLIKNGVLCSEDGPACDSAVQQLGSLSAEVAGRL
jgi:hypothetical protein